MHLVHVVLHKENMIIIDLTGRGHGLGRRNPGLNLASVTYSIPPGTTLEGSKLHQVAWSVAEKVAQFFFGPA